MKYIDITFPTPEENLACDEALLGMCEDGYEGEILRFWESQQYFVVMGSSDRSRSEVYLDECRRRGIPVLRRHSGGGAVVQGPGCLNFALVLKLQGTDHLAGIAESNRYIMDRNRKALAVVTRSAVEVHGYTDLAINGLKFSGNSQRRRQRCLMFHGTFLLSFNLDLISDLLPLPGKRPQYRRDRPHKEFLFNVGVGGEEVKKALRAEWSSREQLESLPTEEIKRLAREKYSDEKWTFRF
jgi:lipoate-protein ligase A